ncbi:MAG TPA: ATP-binding protein [Thermoanaerobaculia bacterium]|jgi:serine/threonine-protein kinase RsbT|nr:ATP-binding protein [Thermoanaerobaculia bacterium]
MKTVETEIGAILAGTISAITQRSIFNRLGLLATMPVGQLSGADRQTVMTELESSVRLFARRNSVELIASCARALGAETPQGMGATASGSGTASDPAAPPPAATKRLPIEQEKDIATARLEAWSESVRIGLSKFTSVKVATAVSELARNIVFYAGKGAIELRSVRDDRGSTNLQITAIDQGPGIDTKKLQEIWGGTYKSQRGMGKGLVAVKKLVDEFNLDTAPGRGTTVMCVFRGER